MAVIDGMIWPSAPASTNALMSGLLAATCS